MAPTDSTPPEGGIESGTKSPSTTTTGSTGAEGRIKSGVKDPSVISPGSGIESGTKSPSMTCTGSTDGQGKIKSGVKDASVTFTDLTPPKCGTESDMKAQPVTSRQDLSIWRLTQTDLNTLETVQYTRFYLVTSDKKHYFGQLSKNPDDITLEEFNAALEQVDEEEFYPKVPTDILLTIAPESLVEGVSAFVKEQNPMMYKDREDHSKPPKGILHEALMMEQIAKSPHPNFIGYHGCRVRRGKITGIVLELLDNTLGQYVSLNPDFQQKLETTQFVEALESAVDHLHSLGLAHNDINPYNIMVRDDGTPVLIDFGGCAPFGQHLQCLGDEEWVGDDIWYSEKRHDTFALGKLREWIQSQSESGGV